MVPISKREASHPLEKAHFCHLYPHSKFCGLYPELFDQLDGPPYLQCPGNAVKVLPEVGVEDLFDSGLSQTFPEHLHNANQICTIIITHNLLLYGDFKSHILAIYLFIPGGNTVITGITSKPETKKIKSYRNV